MLGQTGKEMEFLQNTTHVITSCSSPISIECVWVSPLFFDKMFILFQLKLNHSSVLFCLFFNKRTDYDIINLSFSAYLRDK